MPHRCHSPTRTTKGGRATPPLSRPQLREPRYFAGGYAGAAMGSTVTDLVGSFSSTLDSAISSYEATQKSSSSGGGGFSGGGGGGGGGGGSW